MTKQNARPEATSAERSRCALPEDKQNTGKTRLFSQVRASALALTASAPFLAREPHVPDGAAFCFCVLGLVGATSRPLHFYLQLSLLHCIH